jgi:hypothetical protein
MFVNYQSYFSYEKNNHGNKIPWLRLVTASQVGGKHEKTSFFLYFYFCYYYY